MPKVELGSPIQLLTQPVPGPKGREKAANPFADLLSSMDSERPEPVAGVPETVPVEADPPQPSEEHPRDVTPGSSTSEGLEDAPSANDAEVIEGPAQEQPVDARESAPPDQAVPPEGSTRDTRTPEPVLRPEPKSNVAQQAVIADAAPTAAPAKPSTDLLAAAPEISKNSPEPSEPKVAATPAKAGPGSTSALPLAAKAGDELAQASTEHAVQSENEVGTSAKTTAAPAKSTEDAVNETQAPRPKLRVRLATLPLTKPDAPSAEGKPDDQSVAATPTTATRAVEPGLHEAHAESDNQRQDASHSSQQDRTTYSTPASSQTTPTPGPSTQSLGPAVAAAQNQAGGAQKAGTGHGSGTATVAVPVLSGAQVKQMALDRLTAQAPLLKQGIEQASFIPQAAKGLAMALKQSDGTITLKLTPGHLGALKIEVTLQGTEVSAKMEASTESARQLLIDSQPSLRAALEARGLSVERIEVTTPQGAPAQDARDQRNPGQHQDHPGAGFAGQGDAGRHTGRNAEAFAGGQGRALGHRDEEGTGVTEDPWTETQSTALTVSLDNGGTYRLHLDAVA